VFAVGATLPAGLIALSEHWLDTVAFAATAVVVAMGPLLGIARQHATESEIESRVESTRAEEGTRKES
jgi:hypothetical protein